MEFAPVVPRQFVVVRRILLIDVGGFLVEIGEPNQKEFLAPQDVDIFIAGVVDPEFEPAGIAGVDMETRDIDQTPGLEGGLDRNQPDGISGNTDPFFRDEDRELAARNTKYIARLEPGDTIRAIAADHSLRSHF